MKKNIIPLLLLLLLPGCIPSDKNIWYRPSVKKTQKQKMYRRTKKISMDLPVESPQETTFDEELDSFVLLDDVEEETAKPQDGLEVGSYEDVYLDEDDDITFVDDRDAESYDFKTAYYDFDRSIIRADQQPTFEHNVALIKRAVRDGKKIVVEGHADSAAGTRAYNLQISQKRAQTAADWYIAQEIPAESIKVIGRGSEMLIVAYGDKNEQAPNRRVEVYVTSSSS